MTKAVLPYRTIGRIISYLSELPYTWKFACCFIFTNFMDFAQSQIKFREILPCHTFYVAMWIIRKNIFREIILKMPICKNLVTRKFPGIWYSKKAFTKSNWGVKTIISVIHHAIERSLVAVNITKHHHSSSQNLLIYYTVLQSLGNVFMSKTQGRQEIFAK